jgi:cobalt-zinc-cadmium efflux system membrane fusion protein
MMKDAATLSILRAFTWSLSFLIASAVYAGPGHDHGDEAPILGSSNAPKRQPTGEVFLPKPAQRQLSIRTVEVQMEKLSKVVELNGKVAIDPQTGGILQTVFGGRFLPSEKGVPQLGQQVSKGQVLGYIHSHQAPLERSAQQAQIAELQSKLTLAEGRLSRIQQLADTLPKRDLEAATGEVSSLRGQVTALSGGINSREALLSPAAGVIASSAAVAGKIFNEGDVLFEVINPSVVRVEASWFDSTSVPRFSAASVSTNNQVLRLSYLGAASSLQGQSLTLAFESRQAKGVQFATGQLLKVYAEQAEKTDGIAVPSASVVKNPSNQTIVWVKKDPETFEPKVVLTEPLNGTHLLVKNGLSAGDRVVVQGATLINQVR